jgi:hypothetical protein
MSQVRPISEHRSRRIRWVRPTQPRSGMLARSSRSERVESHPLRQTVRHSMRLRPETHECHFLSGACATLSRIFPDHLATLRPEQVGCKARVSAAAACHVSALRGPRRVSCSSATGDDRMPVSGAHDVSKSALLVRIRWY